MSLKAERTSAIQRSLETRERQPLACFDSRKYIQHNVLLGDGLEPILAFMDSLPPDRTLVDRFINEVLIGADYSELDRFFAGDALLQHHPVLPDGGVVDGLAAQRLCPAPPASQADRRG